MNHTTPSPNNFPRLLEDYKSALNILDNSNNLTEEQALKIIDVSEKL